MNILNTFSGIIFLFIASRKPSYKKPVSKYSQLKKLSGKGKPRYRDHPPHHPKNKQIRPPLPPLRPTHLHKPHKVNPKQIRPNLRQAPKKAPEPAQRRDSSYGAPPAPQPKVIEFIDFFCINCNLSPKGRSIFIENLLNL